MRPGTSRRRCHHVRGGRALSRSGNPWREGTLPRSVVIPSSNRRLMVAQMVATMPTSHDTSACAEPRQPSTSSRAECRVQSSEFIFVRRDLRSNSGIQDAVDPDGGMHGRESEVRGAIRSSGSLAGDQPAEFSPQAWQGTARRTHPLNQLHQNACHNFAHPAPNSRPRRLFMAK